MREYYDRLGVCVGASAREIRAAYRRRARQYHPDLNPAPGAAEQFKRVHEAYRVLSGAAGPMPGAAGAGGRGGWRPAGGPVAGPCSPLAWLTLMSFGPAAALAGMWWCWAARLFPTAWDAAGREEKA
jgi:hypothetical protein